MFSKIITNSARFIKMPAETQALYFHICLHADDDWVCEAFPIMRLVWATEDSLKLLHIKWFVRILNEELVTYITDRTEHNTIRSDRKVDSVYKDLLLEIVPWIELQESKQRADRKAKNKSSLAGTSHGQPVGSLGKDRIGKDRIGKDRWSKDNKNKYWEFFNVLLTQEEYKRLIKDFWEKRIEEYIRKSDLYLWQSKSNKKKYTDHNLMIRNWLNTANIKKISLSPNPDYDGSDQDWI